MARKDEERKEKISTTWDTGRRKRLLLTLQERQLFDGEIQAILDRERQGQTAWLHSAGAVLRRLERRTDEEFASERVGMRVFLGLQG